MDIPGCLIYMQGFVTFSFMQSGLIISDYVYNYVFSFLPVERLFK